MLQVLPVFNTIEQAYEYGLARKYAIMAIYLGDMMDITNNKNTDTDINFESISKKDYYPRIKVYRSLAL